MKRFAALFLAALMMTALIALTVSAKGNPLKPSDWVCQDDGGNAVTGTAGISLGADGKFLLTAEQNPWLHLVQTVAVKPATDYVFVIVCTLTEGGLRLDYPNAEGTGFIGLSARYDHIGAEFGTQATFRFDFTSGASQTEMEFHIRNCASADVEPWWMKGIGTIDSLQLLEKNALAEPDVEIVEEGGELYYREGGVGVMAGLVEVDGDLYFAGYNGKIVTNKLQNIWANTTEDSSLTGQNRAFGADGKLLTGILNDVYYKDGVAATAGLVEVDGDYYFAGGAGAIVKNKLQYIWANATEDSSLTGKNRAFGADGKLLTGILNDVYYEDGVAKMAGLVEVDGDCYFAGGAGVIVKDKVQYIWANSTDNADLTNTNQTFGADGRMAA